MRNASPQSFAADNPWAALVGRRGDGREDATREVVSGLRKAGLSVGGFRQEPVRRGGEIAGWDALDLHSGARCALARPSDTPEVCVWGFDPDALERCRRWAHGADFDVVCMEIGLAEASGGGHWPTVRELLQGRPCVLLLSMRPRVLARIALSLPDPLAGLELPASHAEQVHFARELQHEIGRGSMHVASREMALE